jgi:hypothetical protein
VEDLRWHSEVVPGALGEHELAISMPTGPSGPARHGKERRRLLGFEPWLRCPGRGDYNIRWADGQEGGFPQGMRGDAGTESFRQTSNFRHSRHEIDYLDIQS